MPNDMKTVFNPATDFSLSRKQPVGSSSSGSGLLWMISGIALASCGGGGGGGGLSLGNLTAPRTTGGLFQQSAPGEYTGSMLETNREVTVATFSELFGFNYLVKDGGTNGVFVSARQGSSEQEATVTINVPGQTPFSFTIAVTGPDAQIIKFINEGSNDVNFVLAELDYENPTDQAGGSSAAGDNRYDFTLSATSTNTAYQAVSESFRFQIEDIYEANEPQQSPTPSIDANGVVRFVWNYHGGATDFVAAVQEVAQSTTLINFGTVEEAIRATDPSIDEMFADGTVSIKSIAGVNDQQVTVTYDVRGQDDYVFTFEFRGPDADFFVIDIVGQNGVDSTIMSVSGPDFESPTDRAGTISVDPTKTINATAGDNVYQVQQVAYTSDARATALDLLPFTIELSLEIINVDGI
jgi:hypothetical protein